MALSKPWDENTHPHDSALSSWQSGIRAVPLGGAWASLAEQLKLGVIDLHRSTQEISLTTPVREIGEDLAGFSFSLGQSLLALPVADIASRAKGSLESLFQLPIASLLSLSPSGEAVAERNGQTDSGPWWQEDKHILFLIAVGMAAPGPCGAVVMAGWSLPVLPATTPLCFFFGGSVMLWKCYHIYTDTAGEGALEDERWKKLALQSLAIAGACNLLASMGGISFVFHAVGIKFGLRTVIMYPNLFLHCMMDAVVNPMMLLVIARSADKSATSVTVLASVLPSMVAASSGSLALATAAAIGGGWSSRFLQLFNLCCILWQNRDMVANFSSKKRTAVITDAFIFAQVLAATPPMFCIALTQPDVVGVLPLIDIIGKLGVVQLSQKPAEYERSSRRRQINGQAAQPGA